MIGKHNPIDKVRINKVNEMDIKVSRFEKSPHQHHNKTHSRIEEMIPNEEPLIEIRQLNGNGAAQSL